MKPQDLKKTYYKKYKEPKRLEVIICFIFTVTMILLSPLIYMIVIRFLNVNISDTADMGKTTHQGEVSVIKAKNYSCIEHILDLTIIENMNYSLLTANVTNNADGILFCGEVMSNERIGEVLRIVKFQKNEEMTAYKHFLPNRFLEKVREQDFVYKDYGDGYIYIADNEDAYLFDLEEMKVAETYFFPTRYEIYQAILSNDKTMIALATDRGLFVTEVQGSAQPKELISAIENVGGVKTLPKNLVWSSNDEYIYYSLYADGYIKNAGRTPLSLGANEQFAALENTKFYVLNDDSIFYYYSTNYHTSFENLFRCGYFNVNDRKMTDAIKSNIYYFDIRVGSGGTHLAALSYNGKMKKISVIDIKTKKNIYSALYEDIYKFAFSPNEKNIIIHGLRNGKEDLRIIEINWIEE